MKGKRIFEQEVEKLEKNARRKSWYRGPKSNIHETLELDPAMLI